MLKPWDCEISLDTEHHILLLINKLIKKPLNDLKILDFGAGNGRYLKMFAKGVPKKNLWGAEIEEYRIKQLQEVGINVIALNRNSGKLKDLKQNSFDIVFSSNVLEHIQHKIYLQYLAEIHRVLTPGGVFLVGMPNYPFKRIYDIYTAFTNHKFFKYYLLDDPSHINKMSLKQFCVDLGAFFKEINIRPSFGPFERITRKIGCDINQNSILSAFSNKYFGYAKK